MTEIGRIWSAAYNVQLERWLWVTIATVQQDLGLAIPEGALEVGTDVAAQRVAPGTLERIAVRERRTRHDLKARLEVFCEDTGYECWHLGCTSADLVENATLIRMRASATCLEDELGLELDWIRNRMPFRGIKGAVGTMADQVSLLGSVDKALDLDHEVAHRFGFTENLVSVGQVYPRSIDFQAGSELLGATHERIGVMDGAARGWLAVLYGYVSMLNGLVQWNEGDVSSSVVRRVALPGMWQAAESAVRAGQPKRLLEVLAPADPA